MGLLVGEILPITNAEAEAENHIKPNSLMAVDLNQREFWINVFEGLDMNLLAMSTSLEHQAQMEGLTILDVLDHWTVCQRMMKGGSQVDGTKSRVPFVEAVTYSNESAYRSGSCGRGQSAPLQGGRG